MVPNIGRKLTLIFVVLVGAILSLGLPMLQDEFPIRRGLDLQGGIRLVYRVDRDRLSASAGAAANSDSDFAKLIDETIGIIRGRIDPSGVQNITLQRQGTDRILVELPGMKREQAQLVERSITELGKLEFRIVAYKESGTGSQLKGTDVDFESEKTKLTEWWQAELAKGGENWVDENTVRRYNAIAPTLGGPSDGFFWVALENKPDPVEYKGRPLFLSSFYNPDKSEWPSRNEQTGKVLIHGRYDSRSQTFLQPAPIAVGSGSQGDMGHEPVPLRLRRAPSAKPTIHGDWIDMALMRDEDALAPERRWVFTGEHIAETYGDIDSSGYPCVAFVMKGNRADAFADFTDTFTNKYLAILLNDRLSGNPPVINGRLPGRGIIQGQFTQSEVLHLQNVLRSGSLRVPLELMTKDVMGPTLGQDSIRLGGMSAAIGILVVILFMLYYYRRSGRVAATSLLVNMLLLLGALALFRVNLNLPGIAGLILTLGMAVDANILIFERIREERNKKRTLLQSAKNGFDRAFVTIFDSNLTTLITTLVLIWLGTGAIKGFAVVLAIGILTSMFSALVVSRVLFHYLLQRESFTEFDMKRWVPSTAIQFSRFMAPAMLGSLVLGLVGLLVIGGRGKDLLGIDFTGGGTFRVLLKQDTELSEMRSLLQEGFPSVLVFTLGESKRNYGVKVKLDPDVDPELAQEVASSPGIEELVEGTTRRGSGTALGLGEELRFDNVDRVLQFPYPLTDADIAYIQERLYRQGLVSFQTPEWMSDAAQDSNSGTQRTVEIAARKFMRENFDTRSENLLARYVPTRDPGVLTADPEETVLELPRVSLDPGDQRKLRLSARVPAVRLSAYGVESLINHAVRPRYQLGVMGIEQKIRELLGDRLASDFLISDRGVSDEGLEIAPITTAFDLNFRGPVPVDHVRELLHRVGLSQIELLADGAPVTPETEASAYTVRRAVSRWIASDAELGEQLGQVGRRLERVASIPEGSLSGIAVSGKGWNGTERRIAFTLKLRGEAPERDQVVRLLRTIGIDIATPAGLVGMPLDPAALSPAESEERFLQWRLHDGRSAWIVDPAELRESLAIQVRSSFREIILDERVTLHLVADPASDSSPETTIARTLRSGGLLVGGDSAVSRVGELTYAFTADAPMTYTLKEMEERLTDSIARAGDQGRTALEVASPFGDASEISAQASTELRDSAVIALIVALFAITLYIRVRFHEYRYAFGAVLAVFHDVIITTGVVAIFTSLGLVDAEIDLTMVAALLTIIGYSLNDTIVIYDRVRENLPRMEGGMENIVNVSINETLSRTLLTSLTTLFTILVLFALNYGRHNAIEGFAFAILVGILCGTYSTIFIATPFVLWVERRARRGGGGTAVRTEAPQPSTA